MEKREMSPPILTIDVLYSCRGCGLRKVAVSVPARGAEDVVHWLQEIAMPVLAADHKRRSFLCRTDSLADVMIPITGTDRVGGAPSN